MAHNSQKTYTLPLAPTLNQWGFGGSWNVGGESAALQAAPGKVIFRFHARDLHMVLGSAKSRVRFKVTVNGIAPGYNQEPSPIPTAPAKFDNLGCIS
jgi:hypothetical protein